MGLPLPLSGISCVTSGLPLAFPCFPLFPPALRNTCLSRQALSLPFGPHLIYKTGFVSLQTLVALPVNVQYY